jgi:hypothetical protein
LHVYAAGYVLLFYSASGRDTIECDNAADGRFILLTIVDFSVNRQKHIAEAAINLQETTALTTQ